LLAKSGFPLWVQFTPSLVTALIMFLLIKTMVRWAYPPLGTLLPMRFEWKEWKFLLSSSVWIYLCSLGNFIYTSTDRLVINAGFSPEVIPRYQYNYRLCDLAVQLVVTASFVSLPKITQWMASALAAERERALREIRRLNQFQVVLGSATALVYLAINDIFVRIWLGGRYQAPVAWEIAFALNLAITAGGDSGIQVVTRCGVNGIRIAGIAIGITGLINLCLSIISMKLGSITGIAVATVIAQSILSLALGSYACSQLGMARLQWFLRSWGIPMIIIGIAALLKIWLSQNSLLAFGALAIGYLCLLFVTVLLAGIDPSMIRSEIATFRSVIKR
jgi:O-antigen/teichoic acid export membrane protein